MKYKNTLRLLSVISGIGLLCSGCQKKATEASEASEANSTEEAAVGDLSDNLDLEVVVALFAESENVEDFEKKLNEPERQISNLDLNEDGYVDYLRAVESSKEETYLVSVQAELGENLYQDVASFDVEKDEKGQAQIQAVGDTYVYGDNYVVRPTYVRPPLITAWFWAATYRAWRSPYYHGHYPSYYRPWHPLHSHDYCHRVSHHKHSHYSYGYRNGKRSRHSAALYSSARRNDYASKHKAQSFDKRNKGSKNRYELTQKKSKIKGNLANNKGGASQRPVVKPAQKPVVKPVQRHVAKPVAKPVHRPAAKPAQRPAAKPAQKPARRPVAKPAQRPVAKPAKRPAAKPAKRPARKPAQRPARR